MRAGALWDAVEAVASADPDRGVAIARSIKDTGTRAGALAESVYLLAQPDRKGHV